MKKAVGRYSGYIRPFSIALDLTIVNVLAWHFLHNNLNILTYHFFISASWSVISWNVDFYGVYRFTKAVEILAKGLKQYFLFAIINFAYLGFFMQYVLPTQMMQFVSVSVITIIAAKFFVYYSLRRFRAVFGGNLRKVVIVGNDQKAQELALFFNENPDFGYDLIQFFDVKSEPLEEKEGAIQSIFSFVRKNKIDEIYCSVSELEEREIDKFIHFTDNNLKVLKFLPGNKELLSGSITFDYYGYIPVISQRVIPLDNSINKMMKRLFDIVFSLAVIFGVLLWLTPILAILIKLESKGPVFFKQNRNGLNNHEFECFKFRSMKPNSDADLLQTTKNDPRITKIGAFLRKTSLDELPQFVNVLFGEMSVVGPRPHMIKETKRFAKKVDKFMVRHLIKPGITGLAQINGYRGEVETEHDIINRVKYDIFYVENWSILLDLKVVLMTAYNIFKGEEKAY